VANGTLIAYLLLLAVVLLQRVAELKRSERNARWAFQLGGIEYGRNHQAVMKFLPGALIASCAAEVMIFDRSFDPLVGIPMFALVVSCHFIRRSTLRALGRLWSTRIIVVPKLRPVTGGPYRWTRHPSYLAMMIEAIAIPMVHGAWISALIFTIAIGLMLRAQIRCEESALAEHSDYANAMKSRGCLWPKFPHSSSVTI
jgi:methyltransferase